uniref:YncE family protein n=1 Tax=Mycobacterium conspicuum TaxID=44010 RepID=UPI0038CC079C
MEQIAVSPIGPEAGDVYVTNTFSNTVSVINPITRAVTTISLAAGASPEGVAVSPVTGYVYVANGNGTVSVINPATNAVQTITVDSAGGSYGLTAVAVSPKGPEAGDIYVTNYVNGTVSVINPATNAVAYTINVPAGISGNGVAVSPTGPDAGDIYVTSPYAVSVISPTTNDVVQTVDVYSPVEALAISPQTATSTLAAMPAAAPCG